MSYRHHPSDWLAYPKKARTRDSIAEFFATLTREPWMAEGSCVGADPEAWFPGHGPHADATRAAVRLCHRACPVRQQCLTYALDRPELLGVWGGTTDAQRRHLTRKATA